MNKAIVTTLIIPTIILALPAFFLWQISAERISIPAIKLVTNIGTQLTFGDIYPTISYVESEESLNVTTRLFSASQPWPHDHYKPDLVINGKTIVSIYSVVLNTAGLPLFWVFILSLSANKLAHFLIGSSVILAAATCAIFIKVELKISNLLLKDSLFRILTPDGYIKVPDMPPTWLPTVLKPISDVADLTVILVLPILLTYLFCHKNLEAKITPASE